MFNNIKAFADSTEVHCGRTGFSADDHYASFLSALAERTDINYDKVLGVAQFIKARIDSSSHYKKASWKEVGYAGFEFYAATLLMRWGYALSDELLSACLLQNVEYSQVPEHFLPPKTSFYLKKNMYLNDFDLASQVTFSQYDKHIRNYNLFIIKQLYDPACQEPDLALLMLRLASNYSFISLMPDTLPPAVRKNILFLAENANGVLALSLNMKEVYQELLDMVFCKGKPHEYQRIKALIERTSLGNGLYRYESARKVVDDVVLELENSLNSAEFMSDYLTEPKLFPMIKVKGGVKRLFSANRKFAQGRGNVLQDGLDDALRLHITVESECERAAIPRFMAEALGWSEDPLKRDDHRNNKNHPAMHFVFRDPRGLKFEVQIQTEKELSEERDHYLYKIQDYFSEDVDLGQLDKNATAQQIMRNLYDSSLKRVYVRSGKVLHALPAGCTVFDMACHDGQGMTAYAALVEKVPGKHVVVNFSERLQDGWTIVRYVSKEEAGTLAVSDHSGFITDRSLKESRVVYLKRFGKDGAREYKTFLKTGMHMVRGIVDSRKELLNYLWAEHFHFNKQDDFYVAIGMGLISRADIRFGSKRYADSKKMTPDIEKAVIHFQNYNGTNKEKIERILLSYGINSGDPSINVYMAETGGGALMTLDCSKLSASALVSKLCDELMNAGISMKFIYDLELDHSTPEYMMTVHFILKSARTETMQEAEHHAVMARIGKHVQLFCDKHETFRSLNSRNSTFYDQKTKKEHPQIIFTLGFDRIDFDPDNELDRWKDFCEDVTLVFQRSERIFLGVGTSVYKRNNDEYEQIIIPDDGV